MKVSDIENSQMTLSRHEQYKRGLLAVEDLDDEEIARGQVRELDGSFRRGSGKTIPREMHLEMKRRLFERGDQLMQQFYLTAVSTVAEIAMNPNNSPGERLAASKMIIERVRGKEPVVVAFQPNDPVVELFKNLAGQGAAAMEVEGPADVLDVEFEETEA